MPSASSLHTPELAAMIPAYVLGALDGEELAHLEAHLAGGCPECEQEIQRWSGDLEKLATSLPPIVPSEVTRTRLLRALAPPAAQPPSLSPAAGGGGPRQRRLPLWLPRWLPIAAALALLLWSGWAQVGLRRETARLAAERDRVQQEVAALNRELTSTKTEARRLARAMEILSAPGMKPVALASLGGRRGNAQAFVDPVSRRAIFVAANLAPAPAGRTYQLWFIADGKPVSAGTFEVSPGGRAGLEVDDVAPVDQIQAWAVTVEPAGGVPQPTGDMVLKG